MNLLSETIADLIQKKERMEAAIEALQKLNATEPRKQGRRMMSQEERLKVSERMTKYWKKRKENKSCT